MTDQPVLQTASLRLRPFRTSDAVFVQQLAGVREVAETTAHIPHPYPDGAAESWIENLHAQWHAGRVATFAITRASDAVLLGAVGIVIDARQRESELGYWIAFSHWNQGHATEAATALVEFAFAELKLKRVAARHLVRNPASGRIMQKLGMSLTGVQKEPHRQGRIEDVAHYSINFEQWISSK